MKKIPSPLLETYKTEPSLR